MSSDDIIILEQNDNTTCEIHAFGATVLSWVNKGEEMLFVSPKAHFDKKKAIRGGIPIVFPNFGAWEFGPQHGFARINTWKTSGSHKDGNGHATATFTLTDNEQTRAMWNFKFELRYKVTLKEDALQMDFTVANTGDNEFDFTCLLHTYLRTPDVTKATISGLQGLTYVDKVRNDASFVEDRELVTVTDNVDRAYENTPGEHRVTGASGGRTVLITKTNLPDTVVWNPWKEKAAAMSDFADDQYPKMLCVEAGYVAKRKILAGGQKFEASQTFKVI